MLIKKVLIITYYYPPAGGPGVQRWLKFAKYLPEFQIEPIILKPKNPSYPIIDNSLLSEIPKEQKIIEIPIWEPYFIAEILNSENKKFKSGQIDIKKNQSFISKLFLFIRGNFFIPDSRKFWINPCYQFLKKYLLKDKINTIITTGPPHSIHLIGLKLKKNYSNLFWIADFRDPWTQIPLLREINLFNFSKIIHQNAENRVLKNANLVISTSYSDAIQFKKLGANNCITITNGFDSILFTKKEKTKKFTITYSGVLDQLRNPKVLWEILYKLDIDNILNINNFKLKLIGKIDEKIIKELEELYLKKFLIIKGYISHREVIKDIQNSDLLLVTNFNNQQYKGIIPGKLFDYLSTQNKILSIGPQESDIEKILQKTNSGLHFNYKDKIGITSYILSSFKEWNKNQIKNKVNTEQLMKFHRKKLTQYLVEYL